MQVPFDSYTRDNEIIFADQETLVIIDNSCDDYIGYRTENFGMTWDTINLRVSPEQALLVAATSNNSICANFCNNETFEINLDNGPWKEIIVTDDSNVQDGRLENVHSLDNGAFMGAGDGISMSDINGENWKVVYQLSLIHI